MSCSILDCDKPEHAKGLCVGHYRRRRRGVPTSAPLRPYRKPFVSAWEAALEAVDIDTGADADDAYERARERFRKAVIAWVKTLGYRKMSR